MQNNIFFFEKETNIYAGCMERKMGRIKKENMACIIWDFYQAVIIYLSMHTMPKQHQSICIIFLLQNQIHILHVPKKLVSQYFILNGSALV